MWVDTYGRSNEARGSLVLVTADAHARAGGGFSGGSRPSVTDQPSRDQLCPAFTWCRMPDIGSHHA
jgi:hypothetical protein